jgi:hypothetical protein
MTENKRAILAAKQRLEAGLPINARMRKALAKEKKAQDSSWGCYPFSSGKQPSFTPEEELALECRYYNHLDNMEERRLDLESMEDCHNDIS